MLSFNRRFVNFIINDIYRYSAHCQLVIKWILEVYFNNEHVFKTHVAVKKNKTYIVLL